MEDGVRKVRVLVQIGITKGYSTKQLLERDVTIEVLDSEDMAKALRQLMTEEYKQVDARLGKFPETRPLLESTLEEPPLIG